MNPPEPRALSPRFRMIVGGILFIGAAIFILALHQPRDVQSLANIKETGDQWWLNQRQSMPKPLPRALPTPTLRPIIMQAPPRAIPHPQPSICQICIERLERYRKAIETGMGGDTGRMRQLPQVISPAPDLFALGSIR